MKELLFTVDKGKCFIYSDGTYRYSHWGDNDYFQWKIDENGRFIFLEPGEVKWLPYTALEITAIELKEAYFKWKNEQADTAIFS